jgi:hypothetical protein
MNDSNAKCVIILDSEQPLGVIANTSAILGVTLGRHVSGQVGADVMDASKKVHLGIIKIPIVMLKGDKGSIRDLRERLYAPAFGDLLVVDFSDVAQGCHVYDEYVSKAASVPEQEHIYLGIAIYGDKKKVNKLTGSMPLLR